MAQRPHPASPTKEWYFFSISLQALDPNEIGCNLGPDFVRSKRHSPVSLSRVMALVESLLCSGCIKIKPIPSALQSVFKNIGLYGSNRAQIGDDVIATFISSNKTFSSVVHAVLGIGFLKNFLHSWRRGLSLS